MSHTSENTRVFLTRRIPGPGLERLERAGARVIVGQEDPERPLARPALLAGVSAADVLLALLTERVDAELLDANPRLRGVSNYAVGYNNVDVAAATARGIPVTNTPGVLTEATADLTWALLLAVARRIPEAHAYMSSGRYRIWGPSLLLGADVGPGPDDRPSVLGIMGFGRIGRAVARRARGFAMEVLAHDPYARDAVDAAEGVTWAEPAELLERSDFVSLHALLSHETRHMIGEAELRAMKTTAYLVNVARGPLVDETALVRALTEGWIAGAALDVYEHEPAMAPGLAECPNAVLVPHVGSGTVATRARMATMAADNAVAHLRGARAPNCVNPEVYTTAAWRARSA